MTDNDTESGDDTERRQGSDSSEETPETGVQGGGESKTDRQSAPGENVDLPDGAEPPSAPGETVEGPAEAPVADEAFEEVDVDDLDTDEVWTDIAEGTSDDTPVTSDDQTDDTPVTSDDQTDDTPVTPDDQTDDTPVTSDDQTGDTPVTPDDQTDEEETVEVSKHAYCENCRFLSEAPEIHCTHEGTEIVEFIDMETVRLSNCPIVAERAGLDDGVSGGGTDLGDIQRG
ncbi:MAG: hypothetical protein ACI9K3_000922 [Halovenus sp.]|jgi:hypothetical protein